MNKNFNKGLQVAIGAIEDTIEDYEKHYKDLNVDKNTAMEVVNVLDTLQFAIRSQEKEGLENG